ncbi:Ktr system potassium transporter B [Jeotgalibacillus sp. S-D1]|uniref:TrkH family potassium uptake protein n=1 Tax=Jeotgalibacillus sp. S-D1 TaxID=2552189 RepID=UPI00105A0568|nr:TrkH family potassium uptake protein [Jeotgalibacillus sp. S-D1]TDL30733.1 Ktr system potassium transporter B [Jeotgalibacillus sp. S-D1]
MRKIGSLNPPQLLIAVFLISIVIGSWLLKLPFSHNGSLSWLDALFTAVSAMTVTGLAVVDTGTTYTLFGEIVIMGLIQLGGLGIMTFAVLFFLLLGKKIGFKERLIIQQSLNQNAAGGIIRLAIQLTIFALIIETFAVIMLSTVWVPELGLWEGLYFSLFHAVSAFNNAGFGLRPDSLMAYAGNPTVNLVISALFILGGIGFTVLIDAWYSRSVRQWSLHTKMMVFGTLVINSVAMLYIFLNEFSNPLTLGALPLDDKLWASYFQAVSPRTAGFNSLDIASLDDSTILFIIVLMFIGAGSASTGGGIKVTTFLIIVLATISFFKRKAEINIFNREIRQELVFKSLAIAMSSVLLVVGALLILTHSEQGMSFIELVFETVSAFGTVGLSMGITGDLSVIGKTVLIIVMFVGKIGPLTLAFSIAKPDHSKIKYPKSDVLAG